MKHIKSFNEYFINEEIQTNNKLIELFDENETNVLDVADFGLTYKGTLIQCVMLDENGEAHFWTGNPETDDYAEELLLDDSSKVDFCNRIANLF